MKQMSNYSDGLLWGEKNHYYACQGGTLYPSVDSASLLRSRDVKTFEMYRWNNLVRVEVKRREYFHIEWQEATANQKHG